MILVALQQLSVWQVQLEAVGQDLKLVPAGPHRLPVTVHLKLIQKLGTMSNVLDCIRGESVTRKKWGRIKRRLGVG